MFPPLLSHGFSSGNKLSAAICFHSVISSLTLLILLLSPSRPHLPHALFYFWFYLLIVLIHLHHHPILSQLKSSACLFCIHVLRRRKLAVLECDCSSPGVDLGPLEYLHSSLFTLIKARNSLPRALRKSRFASFQFRSAVQPAVDEHFVTACIFTVLFYPPTVTGMFRRNIISKSSPKEVIFCLKFCVFQNELNPACLTFTCLLIKVNR